MRLGRAMSIGLLFNYVQKTGRHKLVICALLTSLGLSGWIWWKGQYIEATNGRNQQKDESKPDASEVTKYSIQLRTIYDKTEAQFETTGLEVSSIRTFHPWFNGVTLPSETPWPKLYKDFPEPFPEHAVRLLVVPLESAPSLAAAAASVSGSIIRLLGNIKAFANQQRNYHITVFHTSHPADTRPNPMALDGGVEPGSGPAAQRGPTAEELGEELRLMTEIVGSNAPPVLQLERITMANSGTLLILWTDGTNNMQQIRAQLRSSFPGHSTKQSSIIHTTLLRIVSDQQLSEVTRAAIAQVCKEWTQKLRGRSFVPPAAWYVREREFSTIEGIKDVLKYGA